jgi:hypothetical protein
VVGDLAVSLFTERLVGKHSILSFCRCWENRSDFASSNQDANTKKAGHFSNMVSCTSARNRTCPNSDRSAKSRRCVGPERVTALESTASVDQTGAFWVNLFSGHSDQIQATLPRGTFFVTGRNFAEHALSFIVRILFGDVKIGQFFTIENGSYLGGVSTGGVT